MAKKSNKQLPTVLDGSILVRVNSERLEAFKKKTMQDEGMPHSYKLRQIIDAYNEGRLTITNPNHQ